MANPTKMKTRSNQNNTRVPSESECRVCINNIGVIPIFGSDSSPDISMEVTLSGGIHLEENDDLPKSICEECYKLLEAAVEFRKSAKRADAILKRRRKKRNLVTNEVKVEHDIQNRPFVTEKVVPEDTCDELINFVEMKSPEDTSNLKSETSIDIEFLNEDNIETEVEIANDSEMVMLVVADDKKPKKSVECKVCNLSFESNCEYEEHRTTREHKKKYVMSFLPKNSKKKTDDKETKTVNPKDHKCNICNRLFTKFHYPRHMQTQHKIKMVTSRSTTKKECPVCKRMFHPVALNRHMKKAHGDEKDMPPKVKLECPVCKKLFSKDFYPLHMQRHNQGDTKNYICDQCGKKFFFKSTFYSHRLIHTNDLPHKCEYCPYRGRTKGSLKTHVRTHTGDYPYKCTQCDTRCLTKSNLNAHMQRHRGPVDFICDTCSRGFYRKLDLERHISVIHMGIKNHVCNTCGMAFGYRHGLMSHQLNVHKRVKGVGKAKAVYLKLEEEGLLRPELDNVGK